MRFASFQLVLFVCGMTLNILALAMAVPAVLDVLDGNAEWPAFAVSAALTAFFGSLMAEANRGAKRHIDARTGALVTTASWVLVCAFGALPLKSALRIGYTDAFFEAMSGLTTTGSTVLTGLDDMAPGVLLWRSMLQWIGGLGIIALAMIMLPFLRVGGMQLFHSESSDISERVVPRAVHVVALTALVYVVLTIFSAAGLIAAGMSPFDAINHAMCAIATGGFSTKDASVGAYNSPAIEAVLIASMVAGALPLVFYARLVMNARRALLRERQVPAFLLLWAGAVLAVSVLRWHTGGVPFSSAFRDSAFSVTSILTDTGFTTADYGTWGHWAIGIFLVLLFVGGCAGSTAGAIKIFRWQILLRSMAVQFDHILSPHRVAMVRYGDRPVPPETVDSVRNFFFMYLMTWTVLSIAVMVTGVDFLSAISGVAQAMAGAGPGLGQLVGPAGNFQTIPPAAKWILSAAMLLGRLELSTVYVLLTRGFWRE